MGEQEVITVGLRLGPKFPTHAYNLVHTHVVFRGRFGKLHSRQWQASWNAVAFRYDALRRHDREFRRLLTDTHPVDPHAHRSAQEQELFGFFATASALFECFGYAAYTFLAGTRIPGFRLRTLQDQRRVDLRTRLLPALRTALPAHPLTTGFSRLLRSKAFGEIQDIRNYLSHRTAPTRAIHLGVGDVEYRADQWNLRPHGRANIPVEPGTTASRVVWCSEMLTLLTVRLERYADNRLPPQRARRQ